jgi:ABC-type Fe3+ transport system substrate-binding protein
MVRATHPIGFGGGNRDTLQPFIDAGLNVNVAHAGRSPYVAYDSVGYGMVTLFNRAPNPNAAKVFLNWLLTRETQALLGEKLEQNSRRTDVPLFDEERSRLPGQQYWVLQSEENLPVKNDAITLAKQLRPN